MKQSNVIQEKSFAFAIEIVNTAKWLREENKEYVLFKQLLRCGTSIGANIEEAIGGQSRADFYAKLTIAYKEARETHYWLKLLKATNYLDVDRFDVLDNAIVEIQKILSAIQLSIKQNKSITDS